MKHEGEAMTPTLAEIEARHNDFTALMRQYKITRTAQELHDDRAHLLRLVRERDARLDKIADIAKSSLENANEGYRVSTDDVARIHALATKEGT